MSSVLSNVAYLLAAVVVAHGAGPAGWVFIAIMAFLTVGSAGYHAKLPGWNHLDVMGMYAVGLYLWLVVLRLPYGEYFGPISGGVLAGVGAYLLRMKQLDVPMEVKIGALFGVVYVTAFLFYGPDRHLIASAATMVTALLVRRYSHAVWHLGSAIGLGLLWLGVRP